MGLSCSTSLLICSASCSSAGSGTGGCSGGLVWSVPQVAPYSLIVFHSVQKSNSKSIVSVEKHNDKLYFPTDVY